MRDGGNSSCIDATHRPSDEFKKTDQESFHKQKCLFPVLYIKHTRAKQNVITDQPVFTELNLEEVRKCIKLQICNLLQNRRIILVKDQICLTK